MDIGVYSGGGEALYQLANDLHKRQLTVKIVNKSGDDENLPEKFRKYLYRGLSFIRPCDVIDSIDNLFIAPESATCVYFSFPLINKMIWWLSYDNYDGRIFWDKYLPINQKVTNEIPQILSKMIHSVFYVVKYGHTHFPLREVQNISGSYYAESKLSSNDLKSLKLFHSIGVDFLKQGPYTNTNDRQDFVLYNPSKQSTIMNQLIRRHRFHYIPLSNLSIDEMLQLFRKAKLYIDFGSFPGPERLPKETVFNGVNILVGARNAALTDDVLIPSNYKIPLDSSIANIEQKISMMLLNYEKQLHDFDEFREMILGMENEYNNQIYQIFQR